MNDTVDNLVLEHLKPFQAGQDRIDRKIEEMTRRLSNLEAGQASIIQHLGLKTGTNLLISSFCCCKIHSETHTKFLISCSFSLT